ncbi:phosphatidylethanolamine/phosphatidyl-N-methylethanolamine N-methyltransferase [Azospirillum fermentarium]|uniref:class I SAM-dependent methyltransferase n=1 Tax=Azospirillum fermentarium TaxID=1233114 RepID=UPI00222600A7|nr:ribose ABC transporter permease [Azospirillum fermentarium]MCW2249386.1 phosphatidylethanolamine/phosphatidyl-N-methylethanolamine N-methyltransferase [Azospirillum fermentarium]
MRNPLTVGAIAPSGPCLCRSMARAAGAAPGRRIVELGPGTGVMTRALIDAGVEAGDLLLVELDRSFAARLAGAYPGACVVRENACHLRRITRDHGWQGCDAIVSGLPLINFTGAVQLRILSGAFASLGPQGVFVQFTYGPFSPVAPAVLRRLGLTGTRTGWIVRNVPPAFVWTYRRAPGPSPL